MAVNHVYIITGEQGAGKTNMLRFVVDKMHSAGLMTGGFFAEGSWKDDVRDSFRLVRVSDRKSFPLCSTVFQEGSFKLKRFWFNTETINVGKEELQHCLTNDAEVIVIDEIGIFELEGKVWHDSLVSLLEETDKPLVITVRNKIKDKVLKKFNLNNYSFFSTNESPSLVADKIIRSLKRGVK